MYGEKSYGRRYLCEVDYGYGYASDMCIKKDDGNRTAMISTRMEYQRLLLLLLFEVVVLCVSFLFL